MKSAFINVGITIFFGFVLCLWVGYSLHDLETIAADEVTVTDFMPYEIGLNPGGSQSFGSIDAEVNFSINKQDSLNVFKVINMKTPSWGYRSRGVKISGPVSISFGFKADSNFVSVFDKESKGKKITKGDSTLYEIATKVPEMEMLNVNIKTFTEQNTSNFAPNITFKEFSDSLNIHSGRILKSYMAKHPEEIEREYIKNVTTFFYAYIKPFEKKIKLNIKILKNENNNYCP